MVSVPQSRLTDLLRRKTFFSLPFPPPLLSISHPKMFSGNRGMLECPWRMAGHHHSCCLESGGERALLGAGGGKREVWGQTWLDFLWQCFLVCLSFSAPKRVCGSGLGSQIKGTGLEPKLDFSRPGTPHSPVSISVLLKVIGKVNEINMAKHCTLPRRTEPDTCGPLLKYWSGHSDWGHFIEPPSRKT